MGFQQGQAEQILLASFRQFPLRKVGPKPATTGGAAAKSAVRAPMQALKPPPAKKDVDTEPPPEKENKAAAAPVEDTTSKGGDTSNANNDTKKKDSNADGSENSASKKKADTKKDKIRFTDEGKQIPIGNGGSTSRYVWTQTLEEVTVHIPLPEGLRSKDLNVKIGATSLSISPKGGTASESALVPIKGTFFGKIRTSESTWTLESSTHLSEKMTTLQLILDKVHKTWWETVISGDTPLIDTTMVDSTRHIGTYNDETQGEIRRILFDQRQERLGLETSQEMMMGDLPPLPNGEKFNIKSLPPGAEYIDQETLDKASITSKK